MIKKYRLLFPLLYCLTVNAQRPPETYNIGSRFNASCQQEFQEKVYLHTDKSHYISGEHIRFRAFRTEAASHLPTLYSRFIYVELYNPKEELVGQLKVMEKEGVFHGTLPLDKYLPSGTYKLRAFTYWMQNFDEQFYFHKNIEIENTQWPDLQRQTQWEETESRDKILYFRFITKQNTYFPGTFLDCRMYKGQKEIQKDIVRTNSNGWGKFTLRKKDSITTLKIQFLNKKPVEYQTFSRVPQLTDTVDADVQFFPEGGYLLAGIRSQINLKAVGTDGFGIDIYGCIYGKTTGMVTPFASSHRGMGRFTFEVKEGEEYYAMVKMPDGTEKKWNYRK